MAVVKSKSMFVALLQGLLRVCVPEEWQSVDGRLMYNEQGLPMVEQLKNVRLATEGCYLVKG